MELFIKESTLDKRTTITILIIALLQGLSLYALYYRLENNLWPVNDSFISLSLTLLLVIIPITSTLTLRHSKKQFAYWLAILIFSLMLVVTSYFLSDYGRLSHFDLFFSNAIILFVFCFIYVLFLKSSQQEGKFPPSYSTLFGLSWSNCLSLKLAFLFSLILLGILMLWGALFKIVNISFFAELFKKEWFMFPTITVAFAFATIIFRTQINAVDAVQRILRALIKTLLPLLLLIGIMFVAVLPFTGIDLIWQKGYGTGTIIGFVCISLFSFNAVFQDGQNEPYAPLLNTLIRYSMCFLVILIGLCIYGLSLRINQYGWTPDRLWASIFTSIMACFSIAYAVLAFRKQHRPKVFGTINTVMAIIIALTCFLMLTPILDVNRITAQNQFERLLNKKISLDELDYYYLSSLGKAGKYQLEKIKLLPEVKTNSTALADIEKALKHTDRYRRTKHRTATSLLKSEVKIFPRSAVVNAELWEEISSNLYQPCTKDKRCFLLSIDLNSNGQKEFILLKENSVSNHFSVNLIIQTESGLTTTYLKSVTFGKENLEKLLENNQFSTQPSQWNDLKIGDTDITIHD